MPNLDTKLDPNEGPPNAANAGRIFELIRFVLTGGMCAGLNILIVVFLTEYLHFNYLVSIVVCFLTVSLGGFWLNRLWTFRKKGAGVKLDFARYVTVATAQLILSLAFASLCVEVFHIPYLVAIVLLSVAMVPVTFLLHRRWSFGLKWFDAAS